MKKGPTEGASIGDKDQEVLDALGRQARDREEEPATAAREVLPTLRWHALTRERRKELP